MAVTGAIFNSLIFGGVNSANYGIYITGEAVYNAPERAVEMVTVPGRNGAIAIDQGRWENIEVEYPAGCFGDGDANFADRISAFRNAVLSQIGYQRLTDTYHPDEFRMAIYVAGLEVKPANINSAGEFKLIFNCKPQRFLTSGETAVEVTSGGTITNPTLCDAKPIVISVGVGAINIGTQQIKVITQPLGYITLAPAQGYLVGDTRTVTFNGALLLSGDTISTGADVRLDLTSQQGMHSVSGDVDGHSAIASSKFILKSANFDYSSGNATNGYKKSNLVYTWRNLTFAKGTPATVSETINVEYMRNNVPHTGRVVGTVAYDGDETIVFSYTYNAGDVTAPTVNKAGYATKATTADSTRLAIIDPIYIDLEVGEAYVEADGSIVSANDSVSLGGSLPVLRPGSTTITYDNTITDLSIVPRWWKL